MEEINQEKDINQEIEEIEQGDCLYEIDIHMTVHALYDYLLKHTYSSAMGLLGTAVGALLITMFINGYSFIYLACGIVVILYLPWSLFLTAKRQSMSEIFQKPLHYAFYEQGVIVSQGDIKQMQKWEHMYKAISTTQSIILYTGKNQASIFPQRDLGEKRMDLIRVISMHMDSKKVKIKQ